MYQNSIESLTAVQRKDLRRAMGLKAIFPNLRIVKTSCNGSDATILVGKGSSKPRLCLKLKAGEYLNNEKYGLWPVESATYRLAKLRTEKDRGWDEDWPYGYTVDPDEDYGREYLVNFDDGKVDGDAFFRSLFKDVVELSLLYSVTKFSHFRAIIDVASRLETLNIIVAAGPKQSREETKQPFEDTMVKLGHLEHLKHIQLFVTDAQLACLPPLQTLPWKSLESLECNVSPGIALHQLYGDSGVPGQLTKLPQPPPMGTLKKVVLHLEGESNDLPNPMWFVYALLSMCPIDTKISFKVGEQHSFEERSLKCWDYQWGFETLAFAKWVEEAVKAITTEMAANSDAAHSSDSGCS